MRTSLRSIFNRHIIILYLFLIFAALLLIIGTLLDWRPFEVKEKETNIHYIVDSRTTDYKKLRMLGMNAASEDLNVSLFVQSLPPHSDKLFHILDEKPDAIIVGDYIHENLDTFISQAKKHHIPVILADYAANADSALYIGVDHHLVGKMAARYIAPLLQEKGNVAFIGFYEEGSSIEFRKKGVEEELSTYSSIHVQANLRCTETIDPCIKSMKTLILNDEIQGIIALDTRSANEISRLLQQLNKSHDIKVVAFDRSNNIIEFLQDGTIDALLVHNAFNLGYLSIQYANELARDKSVHLVENVNTSIVTGENMFWLQNQKLLFPLNIN